MAAGATVKKLNMLAAELVRSGTIRIDRQRRYLKPMKLLIPEKPVGIIVMALIYRATGFGIRNFQNMAWRFMRERRLKRNHSRFG
jgi:hypothetical protein